LRRLSVVDSRAIDHDTGLHNGMRHAHRVPA